MVNKKNFKIISIITTLLVITTLISLKGLITNATVANRPEFDIQFSPIPESAMVGEDIVIKGTITPKPFEIPVPEQEIVFVIDSDYKSNYGDLNSLMSHTVNFLGKMKGKNIKIANIEYKKEAEIKRANNKSLLNINQNYTEIDNFLTTIDKKTEKTNTGEALRKALYLLNSEESNKYANKTIIFVSDSIPTARTVYSQNSQQYGSFYEDITKEKYINATTDNTNDNDKDLEYAKEMANIVRDKGYNVFTIAYGGKQSTEDTKALKEIHQYMSGNDMSSNNYENDGFFIVQDPKVAERVFGNIADRVLQNYSLNNIKMNLNFTGDFSANISGNTLSLNNINYKLVSQINGKARYEAEPIPFEFVVKGNKEGYQQIFDKVTITYPWQDSIEKVDINKELYITITSNTLPDIRAKLKSNSYIETNKNSDITLEYEIIPNEFTATNLNFTNKEISEAIFMVGLSNNITDGNRELFFQNAVSNQILDNLKSIKYGVIAYNDYNYYVGDNINEKHTDLSRDDAELKVNPTIQNIVSPLYDINIGQNKDEFRYYLSNDNQAESIFKYKSSDSSKKMNIDNSLEIAIEIFDKFGDEKKGKAIVLVNATNVEYSTNIANKIKNKGYKIISLDVIDNTSINYKNLHQSMGGIDNDYLIPKSDNGPFNNTDYYMQEVAKRLSSGITNNDIAILPKLTFDLNNNFEYVEGFNNNINLLSNNGNKLEFSLVNHIKYQNSGVMVDGKYKFTASPQTISFKVRLKETDKPTLTFGINNSDRLSNYMSYTNFTNKELKVMLQTPIITIKEEVKDITHGLYNGINNGQISIAENNNGNSFEIAQGSTVTFGASFTFSGSSTEFNLNLDNKFSTLNTSNIKIYKVLKDASGNSTLKELDDTNKDIVDNGGNKFKISIKNITDTSTDILVIYQGKIKEDIGAEQTLTNNIVFGSTSKSTSIVTPQQSTDSPILPDLF